MDSERLSIYLRSLQPESSGILGEIEQHAAQYRVPIIRRETAAFLKTLIAMQRPGQILEVGTATGYSALCMSEALDANGQITTIEKYEKRIPIARENFRRAGKESDIILI